MTEGARFHHRLAQWPAYPSIVRPFDSCGQLSLYPVMLPDIAKHARGLLISGEPTENLVDAIRTLGVKLHSYRLKRAGGTPRQRSADFLRCCGMTPERVGDLVARGAVL